MLCVVIVVKHIWSSGRYYTSLTRGVRSPSLAYCVFFFSFKNAISIPHWKWNTGKLSY